MSFPRRRESSKAYKKTSFFICLFYQICNLLYSIKVIYSGSPPTRGDLVAWIGKTYCVTPWLDHGVHKNNKKY
ncbi:hypothetical protein [Rickettsia sp.]|uniref:hypothetical protein n=1 Tax=Rickettsia sp. TaxID=789 RepID=UPI00397AE7CE